MMLVRASIVVGMVMAAVFVASAGDREVHEARKPLALLPLRIGDWSGRDASPFDDDVISALGVDEYINREYVAGRTAPLALYVGYYASQRQGDTIHSPQNCLPGAGWQPVERETIHVASGARSADINRYVVQKGGDRAVVLYWYQGRGRVTASDYSNKLWLMVDAARVHRTDGGLVRVIAPAVGDPSRPGVDAVAFATRLLSLLSEYLP
jgi:EpsI family protein